VFLKNTDVLQPI